MSEELEMGLVGMIDFKKLKRVAQLKEDLVTVTVYDADSKEHLMDAFVNRQAVEYSLKSRTATFWSTSRDELWVKGLTSGNSLALVEIRVNCEQSSFV